MSRYDVHPAGTRKSRILDVLTAATGPMSLSQIVRAIGERTPHGPNVVSTVARIVHDLLLDRQVARSGAPRSYAYRLPDRAFSYGARPGEERIVWPVAPAPAPAPVLPPARARESRAQAPETVEQFIARGGSVQVLPTFAHPVLSPSEAGLTTAAPRSRGQQLAAKKRARVDAIDADDPETADDLVDA